MEFDAVFSVRKEFSKDVFLREVLIKIGINEDTPLDVVEAEFGEVNETMREVIVCTASVTGTCTASVGYDRQESYIDYETYREKVGNSYVTRQRPVTRYRTVTDWQIFQTPYVGEATCAAYNSDAYGFDDSGIVKAIKTVSRDRVVAEGTATVNPTGLARAVAACEGNVESSQVIFPGDRHKDVQYHSESEIQCVSCYKLPYYDVTYTYKGEEYVACGFACGEISIRAATPPKDVDITELVKEETADLEKQKSIAWKCFTVSLIVTAALCLLLKFGWLFPVPIVLLLRAKKDSKTYSDAYEACSARYSKEFAKVKVEAVEEALAKRGYEPLGADHGSFENWKVPGAKTLKPISSRVAWSWVLSVIVAIVCLFTMYSSYQNFLHSPKQMKIEVVDMQTEYDPEASPYINGCYYIHLDYEIQAKKLGIEYVDLKVHVSEKGGEELGVIHSSLSYVDLEAHDEKVITTTWSENQPEKNDFFSELYDKEFSELDFEFEVGSIRFSDGKYYHNDDYDRFG